MTYKDVVDRIQQTVTDHKMIADFGYGQLSDIKVLDDDGDGADYPYAFLLPTGANRSNNAMTYNFSLIMMEMALNPTQILKVQSDCIQYLNDIVANLRFDDQFRGDVLLTQSITVFRERFQDEVAGATANIQITVTDTINDCYGIAPEFDLVAQVVKTVQQLHRPDLEQSPISFQDIILDIEDGWRPPAEGGNTYTSPNGGTYEVTVTGTVSRVTEGQWPTVPDLKLQLDAFYIAPDEYSWPNDVAIGEDVEWSATWRNVEVDPNEYFAITFPDEPPLECALYTRVGTTIKISKLS